MNFNFLIIYLTTLLIIFFVKDQYFISFCIKTRKNFIFFRVFVFISIFFSFFIFFRVLSFFNSRNPIDLVRIYYGYNIILLLVLLMLYFYFFIKVYTMVIFFFKYNFLKLHFFFLNPINCVFYKKYTKTIIFITSWNYRISLFFFRKKINITRFNKFFYYFFRYFLDFLIILLFLFDICFNNKVLICSMYFLPYYGLYKFVFNVNYFFIYDLDLQKDMQISYLIYRDEEFLLKFKPYNYAIEVEDKTLATYIHCGLLKSYLI